MTALRDLPLGEAFLYWIPSLLIVVIMVVVLCVSFWRFRRKKMTKRKSHYEYMDANLNVKRPRIGGIHCFSHEYRITDLTLSLASHDLPWERSPLQPYGRPFGRSISNPGFDRYGRTLGVLREETDPRQHLRPVEESVWSPSMHDDYESPVMPSAMNSYYEDCGLPVPSAKSRKKTTSDGGRKTSGLGSMFRGHPTIHSGSSNSPAELCNRIESASRSPRRLPDMDNSYWRSVDPKTVAAMGYHPDSFAFNPDDPRSLSQQYEYDLHVIHPEPTTHRKKRKKSFKEAARQVVSNRREEANAASTQTPKKKKKKGHRKKIRDIEQPGPGQPGQPGQPYRVRLWDPHQKRIFWLSPEDVAQSTL